METSSHQGSRRLRNCLVAMLHVMVVSSLPCTPNTHSHSHSCLHTHGQCSTAGRGQGTAGTKNAKAEPSAPGQKTIHCRARASPPAQRGAPRDIGPHLSSVCAFLHARTKGGALQRRFGNDGERMVRCPAHPELALLIRGPRDCCCGVMRVVKVNFVIIRGASLGARPAFRKRIAC
ncbi:uncharacterized protein K452DRAFT_28468 [Aplosporella prunicola CBS 121167]|uniref:Secreted protein n=1 Tax=Aplosporella prunicola CBS 121167 TaxID=1176127 RepID=A0A6A6BI43_9PEZI|nr:uncharacterized protein K452DRAFT_28468 [Aplosporella prunicola CBS 121167]KAF2142221.1 hypothetical protein K452DRAFT_28468 [Aplosporella prunicola CBS 121167]